MSRALVITHDAAEGPGLLATWLAEGGLDSIVVEPWNGDELPASLDGYAALVVLGGPQQAYDDSSAPWLRRTKELLRSAVAAQVPTFAICLGAQLLAEATGGRVATGDSGPELGAKLVAKRDQAANDPLFWDLPLSPIVVQWHWDVVADLPPAATLLMSSPTYPHQAFRVGDRAWGLQFHIETPPEMLDAWVEGSAVELDALGRDPQAILDRALPALAEIYEVWGEVVRRFGRLAVGG